MGDPTSNAVGLPPKPPDPVIIGGSHQLPSFHHTPAGLTFPKLDPIDLQNSSTAAVLIETISTPANSGHQHAGEPPPMCSPALGDPILALSIADISIPTSSGWPIALNSAGNKHYAHHGSIFWPT
ncbi:hypothetical protein Fot_05082 [Forsythia ovata]|uniref:Uncharacterized protein n=1 Tax=Forsythia ovata TaxID=205694 RepID=A0ABD1WS00_9LAMI